MESAQLVQAKYLSDLKALPDVRSTIIATSLRKLAVYQIENQGIIGALRDKNLVWIAAARTQQNWKALLDSALNGHQSTLKANAEVAIPMWLDRWDKWGFRFYYREWEAPPPATLREVRLNFYRRGAFP